VAKFGGKNDEFRSKIVEVRVFDFGIFVGNKGVVWISSIFCPHIPESCRRGGVCTVRLARLGHKGSPNDMSVRVTVSWEPGNCGAESENLVESIAQRLGPCL